jgi:hypothetical protein
MMPKYLVFILLLASACKDAPKSTDVLPYNPYPRKDYFPTIQAVKDTLNKFDAFERFFYNKDLDYNICIDYFEGQRIGIVSTDNLYILIKKDEKDWDVLSIDSAFGVKWRDIRLEDINGDGFQDIKTADGGGPRGISAVYFHIYNPTTKRFKYNPYFDGFDVSFDAKTGRVHKMLEDKHIGVKSRYNIVADSLILVDNIEWYTPEERIIHTTYKNGKLVSSKKITKSLREYFKKTLWMNKD